MENEQRLNECYTKKNMLSGYNILIGLRQLFTAMEDNRFKELALNLIGLESNEK